VIYPVRLSAGALVMAGWVISLIFFRPPDKYQDDTAKCVRNSFCHNAFVFIITPPRR
jgi:hypothetical protein